MGTTPLRIDTPHRQVMAEFERRYHAWCGASAAAEAAERDFAGRLREHEVGRGQAPGGPAIRQVLDLQAAASRLQQEAMQVLRDAPL